MGKDIGLRKIFKTTFRIIGGFLLLFISLVLIYLLMAILLSLIEVKEKQEADSQVEIYIQTNGVHTDFVLPIKYDTIDWSRKIHFENTPGKDSLMQYISFGWGDRDFYLNTPTWADLKFSTAFNASFGLTRSAIHITFYKSVEESRNCIKLKLSKRQYLLLKNYLESYFIKNDRGNYINIPFNPAYYGPDDSFYKANGHYSLFFTCNTWTNRGLKICGQKACLWTPFDKGIFYHYRKK
jgi:uncharacterized protein (TIGR02117 family)